MAFVGADLDSDPAHLEVMDSLHRCDLLVL